MHRVDFLLFFSQVGMQKISVRSNASCIELFIKMESPAEPALNFEIISVTLYQFLVLYALKDFLIKRFGSLLEHTT